MLVFCAASNSSRESFAPDTDPPATRHDTHIVLIRDGHKLPECVKYRGKDWSSNCTIAVEEQSIKESVQYLRLIQNNEKLEMIWRDDSVEKLFLDFIE